MPADGRRRAHGRAAARRRDRRRLVRGRRRRSGSRRSRTASRARRASRSQFNDAARRPDLRRRPCATTSAPPCSPPRRRSITGRRAHFAAGETVVVRLRFENWFTPARYTLTPSVARAGMGADAHRPARRPGLAGRPRRALHRRGRRPAARVRDRAPVSTARRTLEAARYGPTRSATTLRRFVNLTLTLAQRPTSSSSTSARCSATCGRSCGRCCSSACSTSSSRDRSRSGAQVPHYPVIC